MDSRGKKREKKILLQASSCMLGWSGGVHFNGNADIFLPLNTMNTTETSTSVVKGMWHAPGPNRHGVSGLQCREIAR